MKIPSWQEKVALISGGSSGIGLAAARQLAAQGAHVWIMARRREQLDLALAEIQAACLSANQHCGALTVDVADAHQVQDAVTLVTQQAGVPDLVINSAGISYPGVAHEVGLDVFEQMMQVNYLGTVYVVKAVLPGMMLRKSGSIINISSMAGLIGVYGYTAYSASKYAVVGFSEVLRSELRPLGIRVSVVCPPDTDTPQLAFEEPLKPAETKALTAKVTALSADQVARSMLKQAAQGRFLIFNSLDSKILYYLSRYLGELSYWIMDGLVARAQSAARAQSVTGISNRGASPLSENRSPDNEDSPRI